MKPNYAKYLQSAHWKKTRARILKRAGGKCENCGRSPGLLQVHHLTYERLGQERDGDLVALCAVCHSAEHPDKIPLEGQPSFVGDHACQMCPCETAEIFVDGMAIRYICTGCGNLDLVYRKGQSPDEYHVRRLKREREPRETRKPKATVRRGAPSARQLRKKAATPHWTF